MTTPRLGLRRTVLALLCLLCAAPTPGDIGGCGQQPQLLDAKKFFQQKHAIDCGACAQCGLATRACGWVCDPSNTPTSFPTGCFPLVHDGEVCLRALSYSDCEDYQSYLNEDAPNIPSECNFCPNRTHRDGGDG